MSTAALALTPPTADRPRERLPLRRVQEALRGGNEQFVVARRVR